MWIADTGRDRVIRARADGAIQSVASGPAMAAPRGVVAAAGGAYVAAGDAIHAIAPDGAIRTLLRGAPLIQPWGLAIDDEAGQLYVADVGAAAIWRVELGVASARGPAIARIVLGEASLRRPSGVALSPDRQRLYVVAAAPLTVLAIRLQTTDTTTDTTAVTPPGAFGHDRAAGQTAADAHRAYPDLALTRAGLVVADPDGAAIWGVNPRHGTAVAVWSADARPALSAPAGIASDRARRALVVADAGADRLVRIDPAAGVAVPVALS